MNKSTRYSLEARERAVRLVFGHQAEHDSQFTVGGNRLDCGQGLCEGLTGSERERLGHN